MASDYLYPDLTAKACKDIELIRRYILEHPDYLNSAPYDDIVIRYLRDWFMAPPGKEAPAVDNEKLAQQHQLVESLTSEQQVDALQREVVELYAALKGAKPTGHDINSELMAYFKTSSSLIEKLLSFQERCLGLKQVQEFHQIVMHVMETVLTPEQRGKVLEEMRNAIKL